MLYAKLGNKQIKISKDSQKEYEKRGYYIFEFDGKKKKDIFKPKNVKDLVAQNAALEAEIVKLKKELANLQTK